MNGSLVIGLIAGYYLGLGLSFFFRWSEDNHMLTFLEYMDERQKWVKAKNEERTDLSFEDWLRS